MISVYISESFLVASVKVEIAKHCPDSSNLRQTKSFQITSLLSFNSGDSYLQLN